MALPSCPCLDSKLLTTTLHPGLLAIRLYHLLRRSRFGRHVGAAFPDGIGLRRRTRDDPLCNLPVHNDIRGRCCRSSLLGARCITVWLSRACSLCLPNCVTAASLGEKARSPSASAHHEKGIGELFNQARSQTAQARPSSSTSQPKTGLD